MDRLQKFKKVKRIVVKVGTAVLTRDDYAVNIVRMRHLVSQLALLHAKGYEIVLVSSGAILVGAKALGYKHRPKKLTIKQASAAVGQGRLIQLYQKMFAKKKAYSSVRFYSRGQTWKTGRDMSTQKILCWNYSE